MPKDFDSCVANGGKVRRISGPNKHWGLQEGEYMNVCTRAGEWHRGEVHKKKDDADSETDKADLVSLKLTEKEREYPKDAGMTAAPIEAKKPEFPWGLVIRLENEALDKLGLALEEFTLHEPVALACVAYVKGKSIRKSESEYGKDDTKDLELQITHMKVVQIKE